jgi:hypothetical protein
MLLNLNSIHGMMYGLNNDRNKLLFSFLSLTYGSVWPQEIIGQWRKLRNEEANMFTVNVLKRV